MAPLSLSPVCVITTYVFAFHVSFHTNLYWLIVHRCHCMCKEKINVLQASCFAALTQPSGAWLFEKCRWSSPLLQSDDGVLHVHFNSSLRTKPFVGGAVMWKPWRRSSYVLVITVTDVGCVMIVCLGSNEPNCCKNLWLKVPLLNFKSAIFPTRVA